MDKKFLIGILLGIILTGLSIAIFVPFWDDSISFGEEFSFKGIPLQVEDKSEDINQMGLFFYNQNKEEKDYKIIYSGVAFKLSINNINYPIKVEKLNYTSIEVTYPTLFQRFLGRFN